MPSKYLFLSESNRQGGLDRPIWKNLPTISQSTRECYLTIIDFKIVFETASIVNDSLNLKMNIPTNNYFSSDNSNPMVAFLDKTDTIHCSLQKGNEIQILTNDNLRNIEFILEDNSGEEIPVDDLDFIQVMIKLDYLDQEQQTEQFLLEMPKRL